MRMTTISNDAKHETAHTTNTRIDNDNLLRKQVVEVEEEAYYTTV